MPAKPKAKKPPARLLRKGRPLSSLVLRGLLLQGSRGNGVACGECVIQAVIQPIAKRLRFFIGVIGMRLPASRVFGDVFLSGRRDFWAIRLKRRGKPFQFTVGGDF